MATYYYYFYYPPADQECSFWCMLQVYDLIDFLSSHPGGDQVIWVRPLLLLLLLLLLVLLTSPFLHHQNYSGDLDASRVFDLSYQSDTAKELMKQFCIWDPVMVLGE